MQIIRKSGGRDARHASYIDWHVRLNLAINLRSFCHKLGGFFFHTLFQGIIFANALAGSEVAHILGYFHGAEMGAAHGAEMREFGALLRQCFIMELFRLIRIEARD